MFFLRASSSWACNRSLVSLRLGIWSFNADSTSPPCSYAALTTIVTPTVGVNT
eukprot:SAG11_NODE_29986_length_305_cov_0.791262_1_plen_52_part_01